MFTGSESSGDDKLPDLGYDTFIEGIEEELEETDETLFNSTEELHTGLVYERGDGGYFHDKNTGYAKRLSSDQRIIFEALLDSERRFLRESTLIRMTGVHTRKALQNIVRRINATFQFVHAVSSERIIEFRHGTSPYSSLGYGITPAYTCGKRREGNKIAQSIVRAETRDRAFLRLLESSSECEVFEIKALMMQS